MTDQPQPQTAAEQIVTMREMALQRLPEEMLKTQRALLERLERDVVPGVPRVGAPAPDFELTALDGSTFRLSEAVERGPVVLSFYRGEWCVFCNVEVRGLQQIHGEVRAAGGEIYLVGPETEQWASQLTEKTESSLPVLLDRKGEVMERYSLAFTLPEELQGMYTARGWTLPDRSEGAGWRLPIPATFVIDGQGIIRARHVVADYMQRMDANDVLDGVRAAAESRSGARP